VMIIDDVITAGTAIRHTMQLIESLGASVSVVTIALDRQEKTLDSDESALQLLQQEQKLPVFSIATLEDLVELLQQDTEKSDILSDIEAYREEYGC